MSQPNDKKDPENDKDPKESENNEFEFYFQFTKPLVLYLPTPEGTIELSLISFVNNLY